MSTSGSMTLAGASTLPVLPEIPIPGATAAHARGGGESLRLHERDEVLGHVVAACTRPSAPPVVAITGPAGVGRSGVLAKVRHRLSERAFTTVGVRVIRNEQDLVRLIGRIAAEFGVPAYRADSAWHLLKRLLDTVTEHSDRFVVFLDDAQRIDRRCFSDLAVLIGALGCGRATVVCAFRGPTAESRAALDMLHQRELVHEQPLRPLGEPAIRHLLADRLRAQPTAELVTAVRTASRGRPAFAHAAVDGYRAANALHIVDRHACLADQRIPRLHNAHPLFADLRALGSPWWPVAKALAVLHPVRGPIPALISEVVGISREHVAVALRALSNAGVVVPGRRPDEWQFQVPALATLLLCCLGPYERHRLSALAVSALWDGRASCDDTNYLPERLVDAGRLVDRDRAVSDLLTHGAAAGPEQGDCANRWGRAASRLVTDPAGRASVLHRHAVTCAVHGKFESATDIADTVLHTYSGQLPAEALRELHMVWVVGSANSGNLAVLRDFVEGGHAVLPGGSAHGAVVLAAALCMLDRWAEARAALHRDPDLWNAAEATTLVIGRTLDAAIRSVLGQVRTDYAVESEWEDDVSASGTAVDVLVVLVRSLAPVGWLQAGETLSQHEPTSGELAIRAALSGRWDQALDRARASIARASAGGRAHGHTTVFRCMADILIARGQLGRARAVLAEARAQQLLLPHLLAVPEATLEAVTGAYEQSLACVAEALEQVSRDESLVLAGTDELLLLMAEYELLRGNQSGAQRCLVRIVEVAQRLGTAESRHHELLARVLVDQDAGAAAEAIANAEERARPCELARTLVTAAGRGFGGRKAMYRAYELFGELDAVLPRAKLRLLMRERGAVVPGRRATVAETERLLATLVAEGLTNSQLAAILGTTDKGVEGRLSRLFRRTGFRSRAELATAALNGEFS